MFCLIKDNDFFIRADEWSDKESFIWKCNKITTFGNNEYFNIDKAYTCPKNREAEDLSELKFFKECQDDICPVALEKTDLGGNHAYDCVDVIIMQEHGKTEADIGSVWKDISGTGTRPKYTLVCMLARYAIRRMREYDSRLSGQCAPA